MADEGILVHARDNSDVMWINHLGGCGDSSYRGYDYWMLGNFGQTNGATGSWCDEPDTYSTYFICEGLI